MPSPSPAILAGRDRVLVSICIVLTVALAWVYLVRLAHPMAPAMAYGTAMAAMGMTMDAPLGYLTVWVGFSACAALAQWAVHETAMLSSAMAASSPRLAGTILVAAGAAMIGAGILTVI